MIKIKLFKESSVQRLFENIKNNLETYRSGTFDGILNDGSLFLDAACELDPKSIEDLYATNGNEREVECCLAIYESLIGVSPYLARDARLWTRLSHVEFLAYARVRWPIPDDDEKAVTHIQRHFFAKGARGIERDNAISRLWWMAKICSKIDNLKLEESLTAFLYQSDVRANIIERPSTSQNPMVLSAVVNKLHESYLGEKTLFERERFRSVMKKLNIEGGVRLLEVLPADEIAAVIEKISD